MGGDRTRPMWTFLVLAMIGSASDGALCPARCRCNDDALNASCASASLEVVPIQLNPEVRHIDLSNNKITDVHFTLSFYNNLLSLDLSDNKIKSLGSDNFESQLNLQHLNLSRNEIGKITKDSLKGLRAVVTLDLSCNHLEELNSDTFRELHSLQVLKLSQNRLMHLEEGVFKSTKHLSELLLDQNVFLEIPTDALVDTPNLQILSLSNNLLKTIKGGEMPNLQKLRTLMLDRNVIDTINQSALSGLITLDHLNLSDNNFTTIPTASLAKLANITNLELSGNFLSRIAPVAFRGLFHLRWLHLDRLEFLERIDARAFVDNINLERIWLDDNIGIDRLPMRLFHGNPHVIYLSIRNNRLTHVEAGHFPLDQLRVLQLAGNPLECNCSLSWLWQLVDEQKRKLAGNGSSGELVIDYREIRCEGPEPLGKVLLSDVTESEVDCSVSWVAVASAAVTAGFIVIVGGGLLYWGPLRRSRDRNDHEREISETRCKTITNGIQYPCENGVKTDFDGVVLEKCMIGPPLALHHEYRSLPLWDPYNADCAGNIYEHLDVNPKTRPHIVYV